MRYLFPIHFIISLLLLTSVLQTTIAIAQNGGQENVESQSTEVAVPVTTDLTTLSSQSKQHRVPILLMFASSDCEYCEQLEEDVIRPMLINGDFDRRVIFRKVMIDGVEQLKDFKGANQDAEKFADKSNVQVTPTLMFVDASGHELAPKVVGYQNTGFYSAYLDAAIEVSQQSILKQQATN
jgi:thioredoxin-related protein